MPGAGGPGPAMAARPEAPRLSVAGLEGAAADFLGARKRRTMNHGARRRGFVISATKPFKPSLPWVAFSQATAGVVWRYVAIAS